MGFAAETSKASSFPNGDLEFCARFCGSARAAVADARVQAPVRTEDEVAPVVVSVRVAHAEHERAARHHGSTVSRDEPLHGVVTRPRRVCDVEAAIARVLRVEGKAEEPLLAEVLDVPTDVEEHPSAAVLDSDYATWLLENVYGSRLTRRRRDQHRMVEPPRKHDLSKRALGGDC